MTPNRNGFKGRTLLVYRHRQADSLLAAGDPSLEANFSATIVPNLFKGCLLVLLLASLCGVGLGYWHDRWSRDRFVAIVQVDGMDFRPGLIHGLFSREVKWSGSLTGAQQGQLMRLSWREPHGDIPATEELELGKYYTAETATVPYAVTISGMPLGLEKNNLALLDQRPQSPIQIVLRLVPKLTR
jgi:hypothetical protein